MKKMAGDGSKDADHARAQKAEQNGARDRRKTKSEEAVDELTDL
jgi:hypothetical protein